MASAFGHALVGYTVARTGTPQPRWLLVVLPFCSVLPDIDVIAFRMGIPYGDPFEHRGFTHSLAFATSLALIAFALDRRRVTFLLVFLATASHGLLDAMTTGGLGVGFWVPFSNERYFLPWRPIRVSPVSVDRFFTARGWTILQSEALWVGLPCLALLVAERAWRGYGASRRR